MNQREQMDYMEIAKRIDEIKNYLNQRNTSYSLYDIDLLISDFIHIKESLGNPGSAINFLTLQKAKIFLEKEYKEPVPEVFLKDVTSSGLKIDYVLSNGKRVIAEAKTTTPNSFKKLDARQKEEVKKVLDKLKNIDADYKYLFVTNIDFANILHIQYSMDLVGITVEVI